jgi:hypothetical protein
MQIKAKEISKVNICLHVVYLITPSLTRATQRRVIGYSIHRIGKCVEGSGRCLILKQYPGTNLK